MDAKVIIYGFCLVAIIAGASFWSYTMGIDEAQKDVFSARQQLAVAEESIKQAQAWLSARKEAAALISAAAIIEKDNEALRGEIATVRTKRRDVAKVFVSTIERARNEFVGITLPELTLSTGARFRNAKVQSFDSEITVLQHSEGVSKVSTTELPPEIQDRLRYGFNPGGLGVSSKESKSTSSNSGSAASDRIVRLGMSTAPVVSPGGESTTTAPVTYGSSETVTSAAVEGQKESLGRVYVPGKGWQRVGAGGTVAAPQLSTPATSGFGYRSPESVSKVKTRAEMEHQNGK
jgi:hypothetical protein